MAKENLSEERQTVVAILVESVWGYSEERKREILDTYQRLRNEGYHPIPAALLTKRAASSSYAYKDNLNVPAFDAVKREISSLEELLPTDHM